MDILCPLRAYEEIEPLIRAGARCFYAGVDATVLFGSEATAAPIINCRPWPGCNFEAEDRLRETYTLLKRYGGRLYLTFNWYGYRTWELAAIMEFLGRQAELDGVIVADLVLIARIRQCHPHLRMILGTVADVQNSSAVEFYRDRGISQIVLPRHLTVREISDIVSRHPTVDFEVFIKNQDCYFSQGLCYYTHDKVEKEVPYKCTSVTQYIPSRQLSQAEIEGLCFHHTTMFNHCGVCVIHDLARVGVAAVKIVGREFPLENKIRDYTFVQRAVDELGCDRATFRERMQQLHHEIYGVSCNHDCMY